jgi:hypothetical protein
MLSPRGGFNHGHDASVDGLGASISAGVNPGQIRVDLNSFVDHRRNKRSLM